jgi:hypothetical protein
MGIINLCDDFRQRLVVKKGENGLVKKREKEHTASFGAGNELYVVFKSVCVRRLIYFR